LFLGLTSGGLLRASRRFSFSVIRDPAIKNDSSAILPFLEITLVFMRRDHVASFIVNADHSIM
jgi:hypothetical protein